MATTCVPIRDIRDTAAFASLVSGAGDVTVTRNGYPAFHCLSEAEYERLASSLSRARLLERLLVVERESAQGRFVDFGSFADEIDSIYGL